MFFDVEEVKDDIKNLSQTVLIKGVTTVQMEKSVFNFSQTKIIGDPSSFIKVKIRSDQIPNYQTDFISPNSSFDQMINSTGEYAFSFKILLRTCKIGEIFIREQNICYECPKNYFSLNGNDTQCSHCPANADCEGGKRIIVRKGFWRSGINSTTIYPCNPLSQPCLGGFESKCRNGHTGILCGSCIFNENEKWFKKAIYFCEKCQNLYIYVIILVIFILLIIGFIVYLIWSRKNQDPESYILIKMITTHIQTISFLSNIKIILPSALSSFNSAQAPATSTESIVFALECFKNYFQGYSVYEVKLYSSLVLVLTTCISVSSFYTFNGLIRKTVTILIKFLLKYFYRF
jgi:hypothetical protein